MRLLMGGGVAGAGVEGSLLVRRGGLEDGNRGGRQVAYHFWVSWWLFLVLGGVVQWVATWRRCDAMRCDGSRWVAGAKEWGCSAGAAAKEAPDHLICAVK